MNIGMYQSAASLSALERWQDVVSQNITSGDETAYRKRTIAFSSQMAGEIQTDPTQPVGRDAGTPMIFPKVLTGINFTYGETQPTRRELDVAIQGEGFFEIQRADGTKAYTRCGEFRMLADRTLVTSTGDPVMSTNGSPITLQQSAGQVVINQNGTVSQGSVNLGKIAIQKFSNDNALIPIAGGYFIAPAGMQPESVDDPTVIQGYIEGSNTSSLREMVDLVVISRAYEANQKIITSADEQMGKTLDALG